MYSWNHIRPEACQKIQILTSRKQWRGSSSKARAELSGKSMPSNKNAQNGGKKINDNVFEGR